MKNGQTDEKWAIPTISDESQRNHKSQHLFRRFM